MESAHRDLLNDMAKLRSISGNNQDSYYPVVFSQPEQVGAHLNIYASFLLVL